MPTALIMIEITKDLDEIHLTYVLPSENQSDQISRGKQNIMHPFCPGLPRTIVWGNLGQLSSNTPRQYGESGTGSTDTT